jgi:hypothetical protein
LKLILIFKDKLGVAVLEVLFIFFDDVPELCVGYEMNPFLCNYLLCDTSGSRTRTELRFLFSV